MWSNADSKGKSVGMLPGRETVGPLLLMGLCTPFAIFIWFTMAKFDGSFVDVFYHLYTLGFINGLSYLYDECPTPFHLLAWKIIIGFSIFELILQKYCPGKEFKATISPTGHIPVYKANGMQCFVISLITLVIMKQQGIPLYIVYDLKGELLSAMATFSLFFCGFLYIKGIYAPSSTDHGTSGNMVLDYYWGIELYPRIFGWDVKTFTNCRFGMMYWAVGIICYADKQMEMNHGVLTNSMAISVILQLVYISKFFWWETGYWCSMDIQHDRAGYYICWGCLVWVPSVYTSPSFFIASHPTELSTFYATLVFTCGIVSIFINYEADEQRAFFRRTWGQCSFYGTPAKTIHATYVTSKGETKESILLASGYWGWARHFHYLPELSGSFFWSCSAGFIRIIPFFYVIFLTILLFDRAFRDDARCHDKYGKSWDKYRSMVKYRVIPGVI